MKEYAEQDVLQLGKRIHNTKRSYLLVNPLQAKHIPVSPTKTYEMSQALGKLLYQTAPEARMVIGFAETATAIAAMAAMSFPEDTVYLHTTREPLGDEPTVNFLEEHSHAVDQQIACRSIAENGTKTIIMIDDEISTGRTIENIVTQLRRTFPALTDVRFVVGSVMNRMEETVRERMRQENIEFVSLVQVQNRDFEAAAQAFTVSEPIPAIKSGCYEPVVTSLDIPNPRTGISVKALKDGLSLLAQETARKIFFSDRTSQKILVLGTEECMTAAIMTGRYIEQTYPDRAVYCHATTRSPIGVCDKSDYPCKNGYQLSSFYEAGRKTYLYNIAEYDCVIVMTDSRQTEQAEQAMRQISHLYGTHCQQIYLIRG